MTAGSALLPRSVPPDRKRGHIGLLKRVMVLLISSISIGRKGGKRNGGGRSISLIALL